MSNTLEDYARAHGLQRALRYGKAADGSEDRLQGLCGHVSYHGRAAVARPDNGSGKDHDERIACHTTDRGVMQLLMRVDDAELLIDGGNEWTVLLLLDDLPIACDIMWM